MLRIIAVIAILLAGIGAIAGLKTANAACVGQSTNEFKPYYNCGTHVIIFKWRVDDSDCFDEIYFRATPQGFNGVILNKQTVKNNDAPDSGPSDDHGTQRWLFDGTKMTKNQADTLRLYGIPITFGIDGVTKTFYWHGFDINKQTWDFSKQFGYFHFHVHPDPCIARGL